MAKALIMGRSIVLGENVAQAKVAPLSSAAAANSNTDLACLMDGILSREGAARKSAVPRKEGRRHYAFIRQSAPMHMLCT